LALCRKAKITKNRVELVASNQVVGQLHGDVQLVATNEARLDALILNLGWLRHSGYAR